MSAIECALITIPLGDAELQRTTAALAPARCIVAAPNDDAAIRAALREADVAIVAGDIDRRFLEAPRLRWVHCNHVGVERSARPETFAKGIILTSSAGRSAPALAEHALFFMLALATRSRDLYEAQRRRHWGIRNRGKARPLFGSTLGIVGLGHTGKELATRAKAMGMTVFGYRRHAGETPPGVDRVFCSEAGDPLDALLAGSDYVVLALPLTDATHGLIDRQALAAMKPGAYLINIARGAIVDEAALLDALRAGRLAGAGLDCFSVEPLPKSSPLWRAPNLIVTPHFTPRLPDRDGRTVDIICENIRRYRADERLLNEVTPDMVYSHPLPRGSSARRLGRSVRGFLRRWIRA